MRSTSEYRTTLLRGLLWTTLITIFAACGNNKWDIDPSSVELDSEFRVRNFHNDIKSLPESDTAAIAKLVRVYSEFWCDYSEDILRLGPCFDTTAVSNLRDFLIHENMSDLAAAIDTTSGSDEQIDKISKELEDAFKRFHGLMPTEPVPDVILMNSGFNNAVYPREEYVGVGLDWFIGHEHPILGYLPPDKFPQYRKLRMHPDLISANTIKGWLLVNFSNRGYTGNMLIEDILYWGKILWLTDKCMQTEHKHLIMDWTPEEWAWAEANEDKIWLELQPQDVLFETNRTIYNRWLNEGPFTRAGDIPQESPDRLGAWMGWRIIEDYMDRNPDVELEKLIEDLDYNPMLQSYRP